MCRIVLARNSKEKKRTENLTSLKFRIFCFLSYREIDLFEKNDYFVSLHRCPGQGESFIDLTPSRHRLVGRKKKASVRRYIRIIHICVYIYVIHSETFNHVFTKVYTTIINFLYINLFLTI